MTRLSIVIPAVGPEEALDTTLVSVLENRPRDCEVILAHGPGYEDPYNLGDEVVLVSAESEDSLALLRNGIDSAGGRIVHLLGAGIAATEDWVEPALEKMAQDASLAAVAPTLVDPTNERVVARGIRYTSGGSRQLVGRGQKNRRRRRTAKIDGPLLQAAFLDKSLLERIGPLNDQFGAHHVDTDLAARLRGSELRCESVADSIVTGTVDDAPGGFREAYRAEKLFWHHRHQFSPITRFVSHGLSSLADTARQLPSPSAFGALMGRTFGCVAGLFSATADYETQEADAVVLPLREQRDQSTTRRAA